MAFKMKGYSAFTKETPVEGSKHDTGGVGKVDEKTARQRYQEALKAGTMPKGKPDYFNNFMYRLTGNIKWKIRE